MFECNSCKRQIVAPSPVASYEGLYYHPDCLTCNVCNRSVSGKQFLKEKTGKLICEECNQKTAARCTSCLKIFAPGESYKKLGDNVFYHNECFRCCGPCNKPIPTEFYEMDDGRYVCVTCYDKHGMDFDKVPKEDNYMVPPPPLPFSPQPEKKTEAYQNREPPRDLNTDKLIQDFNASVNITPKGPNAESLPGQQRDAYRPYNPPAPAPAPAPPKEAPAELLCAKCNQKLTGTYTVYNDKKYHTKCFTCCQCNSEFKEKTFFKLNGNPLCRDCHTKNQLKLAAKCYKCSQPILDTIVTFKSGEYHDYCLVCNSCNKKLIGQSIYTDKQERPYCVDCFTKKESKYCAKCSHPIPPNQSNLIFEDKNFHKECFTCKKCSRQIASTESFFKGDDCNGIMCVICTR